MLRAGSAQDKFRAYSLLLKKYLFYEKFLLSFSHQSGTMCHIQRSGQEATLIHILLSIRKAKSFGRNLDKDVAEKAGAVCTIMKTVSVKISH
jgi:hypothetical protein